MQTQYNTSNDFKKHQDIVRRLLEEEKAAREHIEAVRQTTREEIGQAEVQAQQLLADARTSAEHEAREIEAQARHAAESEKEIKPLGLEEEQPLDINLLHERAEQNMETAVRLLFDRVSGREKRKT